MKIIIPLFLLFAVLLFKDEILDLVEPQEVSESSEDLLLQAEEEATSGLSFQELENRRKETEVEARIAREQARLRQMVSKPINSPVKGADEDSFVVDVKGHTLSGDEGLTSEESRTLDAEINKLLADRQRLDELEEASKMEYARRFIETARAKGFIVEMDSNYQIVSVRKIRKRK